MLPARVQDGLIGAIALSLLVSFVIVYGVIFWATWGHANQEPQNGKLPEPPAWIEDPDILSLCTGLAGLVSGIVAVALSQTKPGSGAAAETARSWSARSWTSVKHLFSMEGGRTALTVCYAVTYTLVGLMAAALWIYATYKGAATPGPVKALASLALGLFIPTVRSYFVPNERTPNENPAGSA